jgi:hypothetical protein
MAEALAALWLKLHRKDEREARSTAKPASTATRPQSARMAASALAVATQSVNTSMEPTTRRMGRIWMCSR